MNRLIYFLFFSLLFSCGAVRTSAQSENILTVTFLDSFRLGPTTANPLLGGVSAMDWIPESWIFPSSKKSSSLFLFTDHTPNWPQPGVVPRTLVFGFDTKSKMLKRKFVAFDSSKKGVINSVEAVRFSSSLNAIFYSYESGTTGIVRLNKEKKADTILSMETPANRENRGIEALAVGPDSSLWYCLESGTEEDRANIEFTRLLYNKGSKQHDSNQKSIYRYPFDKCSCLGDSLCMRFNKTLGNGVTELLALPSELGDGFLVLERCFNGKENQVRLFQANISAPGLMSKTLLYDFHAEHLKPDNLEGMAWGPKENGRHVLYVISDDNYNYKNKTPQRTQLIRLQVKN